jgi:hypothetical protein
MSTIKGNGPRVGTTNNVSETTGVATPAAAPRSAGISPARAQQLAAASGGDLNKFAQLIGEEMGLTGRAAADFGARVASLSDELDVLSPRSAQALERAGRTA